MACILNIEQVLSRPIAPDDDSTFGSFWDSNWCCTQYVTYVFRCTGICADTTPCPSLNIHTGDDGVGGVFFPIEVCLADLEKEIDEGDWLGSTTQDYKDLFKEGAAGGHFERSAAYQHWHKNIRGPMQRWMLDKSNFQDTYDLYMTDITATVKSMCVCGEDTLVSNQKLWMTLQDGMLEKAARREFI
tara:strand:- start:5081 stop:5641 length:561 start_codon:yes stop_codon:yes gene_type:complete